MRSYNVALSLLACGAVLLVSPFALADGRDVLRGGVIGHRGQSPMIKRSGITLQRNLAAAASSALSAPSFKARNVAHAQAVGFETGLLAARAAGITSPTKVSRIRNVFSAAASKAGAKFASAFDLAGSKLQAEEASYKKAMNGAGPVAKKFLPDLLGAMTESAGLSRRQLSAKARGTLAAARVEDLSAIVVKNLGLKLNLSGAEIVSNVQKMIPQDDWAYGDIAKMKVRSGKDKTLDAQQLGLVDAGIRLANATWKAGQVHRAAWEGSPKRITPADRAPYNPYDVLMVQMYKDTYREQLVQTGNKTTAQKMAVSRVVFEVFKDLKQLVPDKH